MQLIKVNHSENGMTVNGRELHEFLEIGRDFPTWFKDKVEKFGFIEGEDFSPKTGKTSDGGRPRIDYDLSIDMAKELCMVENNEKGRMARRYFIECEKRLKQIQAEPDSYMIDDPVKRAQRWIVEKQELIAAKEELKEKDEVIALQAPKVALYDTAMSAKNNFTMERVAKTIGYGRNKLFEFLREKKILRDNNLPYEEYRKRGYFDVRQYSITHLTSGIENKTQTLVTPKGMSYIHKMLVDNGKIS